MERAGSYVGGEVMKEFNGYAFDLPEMRKRMRYIVVTKGDLDINNVYAFTNKKELQEYLADDWRKDVLAVFKIEDITSGRIDSSK